MQEVSTLKTTKMWKHTDVVIMFIASRVLFFLIMLLSGKSLSEIYGAFDAVHYRDLAANGYREGYLTAFFPVIPLLIRYTTEVGLIIINNLCFMGSIFLLKELTNNNKWMLAMFAFSPIGFFSMILYTESIFVFLSIAAYYLFVKNKYPALMGVVIGLSVMTRSTGSLLFFALFIGMCAKWIKKSTKLTSIIIAYIPATLLALAYPVFLQVRFGSWKLFMDCQYDYWLRITSSLPRTVVMSVKMIFTDAYPTADFGDKLISSVNESLSLIMLAVMLTFVVIVTIRIIKSHKLDIEDFTLAVYVLLSVLVINGTVRDPMLDTPTTSFYRYYFAIFALFLMYRKSKTNVQQLATILTIGISLMTSYVFCLGLYFY